VNPANESVVRRFFEELWNAGDLAVADDIVAPHHMHHIGEDVRHGPEGVRQMVSYLRAAFPDLHFVLEDLLSDADRVAVRWTATGTQTGPFSSCSPPADTRGGPGWTWCGSRTVFSSSSGPTPMERLFGNNSPNRRSKFEILVSRGTTG
jgi:hypothetical protein